MDGRLELGFVVTLTMEWADGDESGAEPEATTCTDPWTNLHVRTLERKVPTTY